MVEGTTVTSREKAMLKSVKQVLLESVRKVNAAEKDSDIDVRRKALQAEVRDRINRLVRAKRFHSVKVEGNKDRMSKEETLLSGVIVIHREKQLPKHEYAFDIVGDMSGGASVVSKKIS